MAFTFQRTKGRAPVLIPKETIRKALRDHCIECKGSIGSLAPNNSDHVWEFCDCVLAPILPYAFNQKIKISGVRSYLSVPKAAILSVIRKECMSCCGGSPEICKTPTCRLFPYRSGAVTVKKVGKEAAA